MRVALLHTKDTPRAEYLLGAFAEGVKAHGDTPYKVGPDTDLAALDQAAVAVQVCFPNRHHDGSAVPVFRLAAYDRLVAAGKRVVTIDTGFLKSQPEAELVQGPNRFCVDDPKTYHLHDARIYYAVGYGGLKNLGDYCTAGCGPDRWAALKTPLAPWRRAGNHVLVLGQPMHGLSSQHADIYAWYAATVAAVRAVTRRPIVFRQHPRIGVIRASLSRRRADEGRVRDALRGVGNLTFSTSRFLAQDLRGAWAAVAFTTNAAVAAVVGGVPLFAGDRGCMAWDVASPDVRQIEKPRLPDRTAWANRLAYSQWTAAEMRRGACWARLRPFAAGGKAA